MATLLESLGLWALLTTGVSNVIGQLGRLRVDTDDQDTLKQAERTFNQLTQGSEWRAVFQVNPDDFNMIDGQVLTVLQIRDQTRTAFCLQAGYTTSDGLGWQACVDSNSQGLRDMIPFNLGIPPNPVTGDQNFEVHVVRATAEHVADGWAEIWINDRRVGILTGIDNYTEWQIDRIVAGLLDAANSQNTGELYIAGLVIKVDEEQIGSTVENLVGPSPYWKFTDFA